MSVISEDILKNLQRMPTDVVEEVAFVDPPTEEEEEEGAKPKFDRSEYGETPVDPSIEFIDDDDDSDEGSLLNSGPTPIMTDTDDKVERRQQIVSKYGLQLYDSLQASGSILLYNRINKPRSVIARKDQLMQKIYNGEQLDEKEIKELKLLEGTITAFHNKQTSFIANANMDDDLIEEAAELTNQIMQIEGYKPDPKYLLMGILLITPVTNLIAAFSDKMGN